MLHTTTPVEAVSSSLRSDLRAAELTRLSIHHTTTLRWSLPQAVEEFRRAGIGGIGLSLPRLRDFGVDAGARLLRRSGLDVSSLGWIGGFTGAHGHSYDQSVAEGREAVAIARRLRCRTVIVIAGGLAGHIRSHGRRLLVEALGELAPLAAEANVRLAVQPMHPLFENEWSFLTSLDETLDVLARCNSPQVGLAFGAYHLWPEPRLIARIGEVIAGVSVVQLSDWKDDPRCDNDRLLPGDGNIPLREMLEAFEAGGYRGMYEVEVWSRDLWKRDHRGLMTDCARRFCSLMPHSR